MYNVLHEISFKGELFMNIAICDDQLEIAEQFYKIVKNYCAKYDLNINSIQLFQDGKALLEDYNDGKRFHVIFLDIEMPSMSGMEVAKIIRQMDSEVLLIFVTSYPNYMAASFKVEAFDFLQKPVTVEEVEEVLFRCTEKYEQKNTSIIVKTAMGISTVYLKDIVYINSELHYIDFKLVQGEAIRTKMKMNQIETELQPYPQFVRCHQSYMVNLEYVKEVQRQQVLLNVKSPTVLTEIPISRKYIASTKEMFLLYHLKRRRSSV